MTTQRFSLLFFLVAVGVSASPLTAAAAAADASQEADLRPPAGQVCPGGHFVTGFDQRGNIICGEAAGNGAASSTATTATVIAAPASSSGSEGGSAAAAAVVASPAAASSAATQSAGGPAAGAALTIEKVTPWSAPYGSREVDLVISGSGFAQDTVVVFRGETYKPSVDPSGTRLDVTVRTRDLAMGTYPLTVANNEDNRVTLKKGLVVY